MHNKSKEYKESAKERGEEVVVEEEEVEEVQRKAKWTEIDRI